MSSAIEISRNIFCYTGSGAQYVAMIAYNPFKAPKLLVVENMIIAFLE